MEGLSILCSCSILLCILVANSTALDSISAGQIIRDGETIVSAAGNFELGFFSRGDPRKLYLGIWYKKVSSRDVVWVANRNLPLPDGSGILRLESRGVLRLLTSGNGTVWSSNSSRSAEHPVAQLLDTGNLVVRDGNDSHNFLWQSFDFPGNTLLPGMKLGKDLSTGRDRYLSSWKSSDDPAQGDYTARLDNSGYPQILLMEGTTIRSRSGPWSGLQFRGMRDLRPHPFYTSEFVLNENETYYSYQLLNSSVLTRMLLTPNGSLQTLTWTSNGTRDWIVYLTEPDDVCDNYGLCGSFGICNMNSYPPCGCLYGSNLSTQWGREDWSVRCVPRNGFECGNDGFVKYSGLKLPDTQFTWFNESMNLVDCRRICSRNCSCTAYTNTDIGGGGGGCLLWFGDLIDIKEDSINGRDLYVRTAASAIDMNGNSNSKRRVIFIVIPVVLVALVLLGLLLLLRFLKQRKLKKEGTRENEDIELPLFDFKTIVTATDNFSTDNKLGEGGFGSVYMGVLESGQAIAVKRLSKSSRQGLKEFKNEVLCIARLQHRNLVKLLGCCIVEGETMLIYEYMPNKSMDYFIFDKEQNMLLDWPKCYSIISGIARGLLYLHQDSRLRIIHRDLQISNILLDNDMNPKILDFGLARSFGDNETEANTNRVVGTFGYMSPEYVMDGLFSVKSDVFSFGVMVLEIVSGKRNRGFSHPEHNLNLLGHAWRLYEEGQLLELIDASMRDSCSLFEAFRSILIGLLCVQHCPDDRPTMSSVVLMLNSEIELSQPKEPGFFTEKKLLETYLLSSKPEQCSANKVTVTSLVPR